MKKKNRYSCIWGLVIVLVAISAHFEYAFFCVFKIDNTMVSIVLKILAMILTISIILLNMPYWKKKNRREILLLLVLIGGIIAATITIMRYGYVNEDYRGYFLGYMVCVVPAMLGGILLSKKREGMPWQTILQVITIFFAVGIINVLIVGDSTRLYRFYGINYQVLSYMGGVGFCLSSSVFLNYDTDLNKGVFRNKILSKFIMTCIMTIDILAIYFGQGRGAIIMVILFVTGYILGTNLQLKKIWKYLLAVVIVLLLFAVTGLLPMLFREILETRFVFWYKTLIENPMAFIINDPRGKLWIEALKAFIKKPIVGNGLGSVFYEVGYYSHNFVTDILCEQGLIGICILSITIIYIIKKYLKNKSDYITKSVFQIFVIGVVILSFGGYYLYDSEIWFAIGYFFMNIKNIQNKN